MADPVCAKKGHYSIELEPGDYWWCSCGLSRDQPLCDGSHKETDFEPMKFTIAEKGTYNLCGCKRSGNKPYCDGTHEKL